jgi:uncharacterized SAM-binding protein YcdF (DUF218 family)
VIRRFVAGVLTTCLLCIMAISLAGGRSVLTVSMPLKSSEAIVLLAGSYEERAPTAASLYRAGYAGRILLTDDGVKGGWSRVHQRNPYAIERSEELLVRLGVPRRSIVRLPFWKSGTIYDAFAVKDYVVNHKIRSILLVTSDYHSRRSLWIFQRVLRQLPINITIAPASSNASFFPDIALEYVKLAYYRIRFLPFQ